MSSLARQASHRARPLPASSASYASTGPGTDITGTSPRTVDGPLPSDGSAARPYDTLVARLQELKRLAKRLGAHAEQLANAHAAYAKQLHSAAKDDSVAAPLGQASLFLPYPYPGGIQLNSSSTTGLNGNSQTTGGHPQQQQQPVEGQGGYAELLARLSEGATSEAAAHERLAQVARNEIAPKMKQIRTNVKQHVAELEKNVNAQADDVVKDREKNVATLTRLTSVIAATSAAGSGAGAGPEDDPLVVRAAAETAMRTQVAKENELLRLSLAWQDRSKAFEKSIAEEMQRCWSTWEAESSTLHTSAQERSVAMRAQIDALAHEAEWHHFERSGHLVPTTVAIRDLENIDYPCRSDPSTVPVKAGVLQRQKALGRWKDCYFVLSPQGYLHEYASADEPLESPKLSLHLPSCSVGPLSAPPTTTKEREKHRPTFEIEGRQSNSSGLHGALNMQHGETTRKYSAKSWDELQSWHEQVNQFSRANTGTGEDRHAAVPAAVVGAGLPVAAAGGAVAEQGVEAQQQPQYPAQVGGAQMGSGAGSGLAAAAAAGAGSAGIAGAALATSSGTASQHEQSVEAREAAQAREMQISGAGSEQTESKPAYVPTPGVASGADRDLNTKFGPGTAESAATAVGQGPSSSGSASASGGEGLQFLPLAEAQQTTAPAAQVTTPASVDSAAVPQGATTTLAAPTPVSAVFDANANSAQPTRTTPVTAEQIQSQSHEATTDEKKKKKGKRGLFGLGKKK